MQDIKLSHPPAGGAVVVNGEIRGRVFRRKYNAIAAAGRHRNRTNVIEVRPLFLGPPVG